MRSTLALLASAVLSTAQWHGGRGGGWHGRGGHWDWGWDMSGGHHHMHAPGGPPEEKGYKNSTFEQLIDHNDPSLGTFSQFYYYSDEYWKGPGSPVILFTPGEINATGYYSYLTTNRTTGLLASEIGAAVFVLEHRYWGLSSPFPDLTTENMKYLTLENALKDMTYFANNVKLPFAKHIPSNARDVPWVTMVSLESVIKGSVLIVLRAARTLALSLRGWQVSCLVHSGHTTHPALPSRPSQTTGATFCPSKKACPKTARRTSRSSLTTWTTSSCTEATSRSTISRRNS